VRFQRAIKISKIALGIFLPADREQA
jgi:hypothetical protein